MKTGFKLTLRDIIILALFGLLLFERSCSDALPGFLQIGNGGEPEVVERWDTIQLPPIRDEIVIEKPVIKREFDTVRLPGHTDTIALPVDTAAIIADYLLTREYIETYDSDSLKIKVTSYIHKNTLESQTISYELNIPNVIKTINTTQYQNEIYLGPQISMNPGSIDLKATGILRTKRGELYSFYYSPFSREFGLGVYWRVIRWPKNQ